MYLNTCPLTGITDSTVIMSGARECTGHGIPDMPDDNIGFGFTVMYDSVLVRCGGRPHSGSSNTGKHLFGRCQFQINEAHFVSAIKTCYVLDLRKPADQWAWDDSVIGELPVQRAFGLLVYVETTKKLYHIAGTPGVGLQANAAVRLYLKDCQTDSWQYFRFTLGTLMDSTIGEVLAGALQFTHIMSNIQLLSTSTSFTSLDL